MDDLEERRRTEEKTHCLQRDRWISNMKHPVAGRTIWSTKCKEKCESKGETSRDRMWVDVLGSGGHARRERERDLNWIMSSIIDLQITASKTISDRNLGQ